MIRALWFVLGWIFVGVGGLGILLPGLPATGFFVFAAGCFSRSSPRFEQWILDLPTIGPLVRDYRAGLGMRKSIKIRATLMMWLSISMSVTLAIDIVSVKFIVVACGLIGTWFIWIRTPTQPEGLVRS